MDTLKLAVLKEDICEKLSMLTYIISTSVLVDNEEYLKYIQDELETLISNITE